MDPMQDKAGRRARFERTGTAALVSIGAHLALFAALAWLVGRGDPAALSTPTQIRVELVHGSVTATSTEPVPNARTADTERVEAIETDSPEAPVPEAREPANRVEATERPARTDSGERRAAAPESTAPEPTDTETAPAPSERPASPFETLSAAGTRIVAVGAVEPVPSSTRRAAALPTLEDFSRQAAEPEREEIDKEVQRLARDFDELSETSVNQKTWRFEDQTYSATVTRLPAEDPMGIEEALVTVSKVQDGRRWTTELRMQRLAFSHFAQFIDRWDPGVQIHDDIIEGRFHSNSEIFVSNSGGVQPTFLGKVTTARDVNTSQSDRRVRRDSVFLGGLETRVGKIMLPKHSPTDPASDAAVHRFDEDTRIVFQADGSFRWQALESAADPGHANLSEAAHYLISDEKVALHVSGVVNGTVLVYSPEEIVIEGNLIYADDPGRAPQSDDYLGLVSDGTIEIASPDVTGKGDLSVHAAVYAKRRFAVRDYRARDDATLKVYGSITAGTLSATEPRYRTELRFDPRLENTRPPSFPNTDRYELSDWNGRWYPESTF